MYIKNKNNKEHNDANEASEQEAIEDTIEQSDIKKGKNQDQKELELQELTNTLKRLQAEFENYKKRTEKENISIIRNANINLIKEILPVLDSFELALKNNNGENSEITKYQKGLELIYTQLYSTLENQGLKIINTKNQKFDPYKHEVLMVKECDQEDDLIIQEFQKGYMIGENVIRHSKVMIAKHMEECGK